MREHGIGADLSAALDIDDYFYIDFCHLSPTGNLVVAKSIFEKMQTSMRYQATSQNRL
jgi:hypothetical protein